MSRENTSELDLGKRLRQVRKFIKVSQKAFGERIGISDGYLSLIEAGKRHPSVHFLEAIEHKWGIGRKWLENGEGEMIVGPPSPPEISAAQELELMREILLPVAKVIKELLDEHRISLPLEKIFSISIIVYHRMVMDGRIEVDREEVLALIRLAS